MVQGQLTADLEGPTEDDRFSKPRASQGLPLLTLSRPVSSQRLLISSFKPESALRIWIIKDWFNRILDHSSITSGTYLTPGLEHLLLYLPAVCRGWSVEKRQPFKFLCTILGPKGCKNNNWTRQKPHVHTVTVCFHYCLLKYESNHPKRRLVLYKKFNLCFVISYNHIVKGHTVVLQCIAYGRISESHSFAYSPP